MADKVSVKVTGIPKAIDALKNYQIIKRQAIEDILTEVGFKVEKDAKYNCPVDTGRLRSSISTAKSGYPNPSGEDKIQAPLGPRGLVVAIGSNVKYAPFVEHGTYKMSGRLYLTKAYHKNEPEAAKRIAKVMKRKGK